MSDKLSKHIELELSQLHILLDEHGPLIESCASKEPDVIERSAIAAMLHSFYTGIENIFKRIAIECDGALPRGEAWHRELLLQMTRGTAHRTAVISEDLRKELRTYLDFRHVFRNAYTFNLKWDKMADLVKDSARLMEKVEEALHAFIAQERH